MTSLLQRQRARESSLLASPAIGLGEVLEQLDPSVSSSHAGSRVEEALGIFGELAT